MDARLVKRKRDCLKVVVSILTQTLRAVRAARTCRSVTLERSVPRKLAVTCRGGSVRTALAKRRAPQQGKT